jgi:cation:H+ antiporter
VDLHAIFVLNTAFVFLGMGLLYYGGTALVEGAGGIAFHLNMSPLVVGLTVVAFGTSAPELFVSVLSAVQGRMGISVGNVIGSNVINIALVLGIAAVVRPSTVDRLVVRYDIPVMFGSFGLFALFALSWGDSSSVWTGGVLYRWEGAAMIAGLTGYVYHLYQRSQRHGDRPPVAEELEEETLRARPLWLDGVFVGGGVALLAGGAELLVRGASWIALNRLGASERFVGISIVALGTSLPELFTTLVSIRKNEMDISVGNLVGSNIFNSLMVLGTTAMILPIRVGDTSFAVDGLFMVGASVILAVGILRRRIVGRPTGVALLSLYGVYLWYLVATRTL